jgi:hypothetical protein
MNLLPSSSNLNAQGYAFYTVLVDLLLSLHVAPSCPAQHMLFVPVLVIDALQLFGATAPPTFSSVTNAASF